LLITALTTLYDAESPVNDGTLLSLWIDAPLPERMNLGMRIYLRGLQIALRRQRGKTTTFLERDLATLLTQAASREVWAVIGVTLLDDVLDVNAWLSVLALAFQLLPDAQGLDDQPLLLSDPDRIGSLIWMHIEDIETVDQLREWMNVVATLTPAQRWRAFSDTPAEASCMMVANRLWLRESAKATEHQQWDVVYEALTDLATRAFRLELHLLWACAIRAQLVVLAEYLHDLPAAVDVATVALGNTGDNPNAAFLIQECVGRQYAYIRRYDEAYHWLVQALNQPTIIYPLIRLHVLLHAGQATGASDPHGAICYIQEAVDLAATAEEIPTTERVKTLGELAIALWLAGNLPAAFDPWDQACELLLACRADTDTWKDLFVVYGHISGYLSTLARIGQPITQFDDGRPYAAPERGMFLTFRIDRAQRYDQRRDSFLMAQLAGFAEAIGRDERAADWAARGMETARADRQLFVLTNLSLDAIPHLLLDDRYADVLDLALDAGPMQVALIEHYQRTNEILPTTIDIDAVLGPQSSLLWLKADYRSAIVSLLPIIFRIGVITLDQTTRALAHAHEVASLCEQISTTRAERRLWRYAADLFAAIASESTTFDELIQLSNALNGDYDDVLRAVGYLGATLKQTVSPEQVLTLHLVVMPKVYRLFAPPSTTYRRLVLPLLMRYWSKAIATMRFRFRTPSIVEGELHGHIELPENQRAQAILRTVAYGLGVSIPPDAQAWIQEGAGNQE
jgi:hypothetical protein